MTDSLPLLLLLGTALLPLLWPALPRLARRVALAALLTGAAAHHADRVQGLDPYTLARGWLHVRVAAALPDADIAAAAVLADRLDSGPHFRGITRYREEPGGPLLPLSEARARGERVRDQLGEAGWAHLVGGLRALRRAGLSAAHWRALLEGDPLSPTPGWRALAQPFATLTPPGMLRWARWLDPALLLLAAWMLSRQLGREGAAFGLLGLLLSADLVWPAAGTGFLDYASLGLVVMSASAPVTLLPLAAITEGGAVWALAWLPRAVRLLQRANPSGLIPVFLTLGMVWLFPAGHGVDATLDLRATGLPTLGLAPAVQMPIAIVGAAVTLGLLWRRPGASAIVTGGAALVLMWCVVPHQFLAVRALAWARLGAMRARPTATGILVLGVALEAALWASPGPRVVALVGTWLLLTGALWAGPTRR